MTDLVETMVILVAIFLAAPILTDIGRGKPQ